MQKAKIFFVSPKEYDEKAVRKQWKPDTNKILTAVAEIIANTSNVSAEGLSTLIKSWANEKNIGLGRIMAPLRIALVGSLRGPDVFEICSTIGVRNCILRINAAINYNNR